MTDKMKGPRLPATVDQIVECFISSLRSDGHMETETIDRLDDLIRKGVVPKPDEISAALFEPAGNGDA